MKNLISSIQRRSIYYLLPAALTFLFSTCSDKCRVTNTYVYYTPVYSTTAEIKAETGYQDARTIVTPGKIYLYNHTLFINESGKGIHVIDNHDPKNPTPLGFINIPGNYDLAVMNNNLYADSFVDLVVFDITDLTTIKEINRVENLFQHYSSMGFYADAEKGIITDWKPIKNVSIEENECDKQTQPGGGILYEGGIALDMTTASSFNSKAALNPTTVGIGGSMARFTITGKSLYAIDADYLAIVDVSSPSAPVEKNEIQLGWQPETLFPYNNSLFVGTRAGMYIYDVSTPNAPSLLSVYEHIQSCDPVVVEGNYAYVTLYTGGICHYETNELQVIDISNLKAPVLVKTYPMTNPHGLGIDNGTLFICDGDDGLKVYDAHDVNAIQTNQLAQYNNINALDIIPYQNIATMIGSDGLYQYDYSDVKNIKLLSKIAITK